VFPGTELARCQRAAKKNCCFDQKLAPVVFGQTLVSFGCKPDVIGSSLWGALADSLDMKCLLLGMSGKDLSINNVCFWVLLGCMAAAPGQKDRRQRQLCMRRRWTSSRRRRRNIFFVDRRLGGGRGRL
jgi:hypothetical protein